uniref:Uncharacterized protein n=1 Tax=Eutreptiella gymnastica TaxID=73025 RepID=A0A7S1HX20_9EUGL
MPGTGVQNRLAVVPLHCKTGRIHIPRAVGSLSAEWLEIACLPVHVSKERTIAKGCFLSCRSEALPEQVQVQDQQGILRGMNGEELHISMSSTVTPELMSACGISGILPNMNRIVPHFLCGVNTAFI